MTFPDSVGDLPLFNRASIEAGLAARTPRQHATVQNFCFGAACAGAGEPGPDGITVSDLRLFATQRGLLSGEEKDAVCHGLGRSFALRDWSRPGRTVGPVFSGVTATSTRCIGCHRSTRRGITATTGITVYLDLATYLSLAHKSTHLDHVQRIRMGVGHQVERFGMEDGLPPDFTSWAADVQKEMEGTERMIRREIAALLHGSPLSSWVEETHGLGDALYFVLGLIPPLAPIEGMAALPDGSPRYFPNPAKLWRYCGLHPEGGQKRAKGLKSGYSPGLRHTV